MPCNPERTSVRDSHLSDSCRRSQVPSLLLFDIDGTLIDTGGEGGRALLDAVEEVFGVPRSGIPRLELAGATDGGITRQIMNHVGAAFQEERVPEYHESYLRHLRRRLHAPGFAGRLLPGVHDLLAGLASRDDLHLGLLTGNLRIGAEQKLRRFGIWEYFADGAFGDDADDRNLLGPIALARMQRALGAAYHLESVFVIGDTPKDIACAHAFGARSVAVATGSFARRDLETFEPWLVLDSLAREHFLPAVTGYHRPDGLVHA